MDVVVLSPGEGKRFYSEDGERWEATAFVFSNGELSDGGTLARRTVDHAHGIVQDWIVGAQPVQDPLELEAL